MAKKRPVRKGNSDLRQQKHIPVSAIEEIEKQIFSLHSRRQKAGGSVSAALNNQAEGKTLSVRSIEAFKVS